MSPGFPAEEASTATRGRRNTTEEEAEVASKTSSRPPNGEIQEGGRSKEKKLPPPQKPSTSSTPKRVGHLADLSELPLSVLEKALEEARKNKVTKAEGETSKETASESGSRSYL